VKLKLDANGVPEIQDGKPVYVHGDGKEVAIDVPAMQVRIGQLNEEAENHRLKAKDATEKLAGFEGIDDADAARKALAAKEGEVFQLMVGGAFGNSKFVADKLTVPQDMVQAMFGNRFKVDDGKVVAHDAAGNRILSRETPGDPAGFDEALEHLVNAYPHKDSILKAGAPGSGGKGGGQAPPTPPSAPAATGTRPSSTTRTWPASASRSPPRVDHPQPSTPNQRPRSHSTRGRFLWGRRHHRRREAQRNGVRVHGIVGDLASFGGRELSKLPCSFPATRER
jgi:hypothetical protein